MTEPRLRVVFWKRAARQIEEANEWWRANRSAAPDAISEELIRALALASSQPGAGTTATNARLVGVRRVFLRRVGYFLYYRLAPTRDSIEILAFWHAKRAARPQL